MSEQPPSEPFESYRPDDSGGEQAGRGQPRPPYGAASEQPTTQPYSTNPYGGYGDPTHDHPQATTVLVLGIVSVFVGLLGPVAWYLGSKAKKEIEASGGRLGGMQSVQIGWILGIVMTVLLIITVVAGIAILVLVVGVLASTS